MGVALISPWASGMASRVRPWVVAATEVGEGRRVEEEVLEKSYSRRLRSAVEVACCCGKPVAVL